MKDTDKKDLMTQHATARPWMVTSSIEGDVIGINSKVGGWIATFEHPGAIEDAELIIKSVNSHDALVEALENVYELANQSDSVKEWLNDSYDEIKNALKLARGE